MARIAFISICDRNAQGLRLMSARLRQRGHECHIIFLKRYPAPQQLPAESDLDPFAWVGIDRRGRSFRYAAPAPVTQPELDLLRQVLQQVRPGVIGMTVNTPLRRLNARVAQFIRTFSSLPVIWGGYDPTVNPAHCLDFCDFVCIREGDAAILEVAECLDDSQPSTRPTTWPAAATEASLSMSALPWLPISMHSPGATTPPTTSISSRTAGSSSPIRL
jgi:hypothetical protein